MNQEELIQLYVEQYISNLLRYPGVYFRPPIPQNISSKEDPKWKETMRKQVLDSTISALKLADIPYTFVDSESGILSVNEDRAKK